MTRDEFDQILERLEQIQNIAYERYESFYLPEFLAKGGHMRSLQKPIPFIGRPMIACSPEATIDRAIQETNVGFVYQLNHAATFRAKLAQNQPSRRTTKQMIIDGVNYMTDMVNELFIGKSEQIPELSYNVTMQEIIEKLNVILSALQKI